MPIERFYTFVTKTETGSYVPAQYINGDGVKIPVSLDDKTAEEKIRQFLIPDSNVSLEGVVLDITTLIARRIISRDRLKVLE
jgi:hypothetical protein